MGERYMIDYYADTGSDIVIIGAHKCKDHSFKTLGAIIKSICDFPNEHDKETKKLEGQREF